MFLLLSGFRIYWTSCLWSSSSKHVWWLLFQSCICSLFKRQSILSHIVHWKMARGFFLIAQSCENSWLSTPWAEFLLLSGSLPNSLSFFFIHITSLVLLELILFCVLWGLAHYKCTLMTETFCPHWGLLGEQEAFHCGSEPQQSSPQN